MFSLLTKDIVIEKLQKEIERIKEEYRDDEDLSVDYIEGLVDGCKNAIRTVKNI